MAKPRKSPLAAVCQGLVAGALGTAVFTVYQLKTGKMEQPEPPKDWSDTPAPAQVGKRVAGVFEQDVPQVAAHAAAAHDDPEAFLREHAERLDERGIDHSGVKDRGFMDSIYFKDPLGLLIELAAYRFEPPHGHTHADVLFEAHKLRVERGDHNIAQDHLADAIELLVTRSRPSLSDDRTPKSPY